MAVYDRKELATFIGHLVEEKVHGIKMKLPAENLDDNENRCG